MSPSSGSGWRMCFNSTGAREIDRQRTAQALLIFPGPLDFIIDERSRLLDILCRNDDIDAVPQEEMFAR
jgi:hypothetical protein